MPYFIGVDVGTGSARAGLVQKTNEGGRLIRHHVEEISIFKPQAEFFEQSSDDIWKKVCECVKNVTIGILKSEIVGIGFDATCSLVLLDKNFRPLTASPTLSNDQNIIMWMDHRASAEADFINSQNHEILKYVGGKVSLEMEIPKLLWLKKNLNETFQNIHVAFDLPDFLTWRATGQDVRSTCSLTCKWNYDAINQKWPEDYFKSIGLAELAENGFTKIGSKVLFPGDRVGKLSQEAANEMGLQEGTAVACSMIDAHAGALGLIASRSNIAGNDASSKLILISGTSTCHMSVTKECIFSPGCWGPYKHALLSDYYLIEAGQSAAGILIDKLVKSHADYEKVVAELREGENIYDHLFDGVQRLAKCRDLKTVHELTRDFHIYPDFHGNRSPIGDSSLKGMMSGLSMHDSIYVTYLAVVQALAYSTKQIVDSLYHSGRPHFKSILICGGLSKNKLYVQTHADVCGIPVLISNEEESVLVGAAMLGATASGLYRNLEAAVEDLSNSCFEIAPNRDSLDFHSRKFKVFMKMLDDQRSYTEIMKI